MAYDFSDGLNPILNPQVFDRLEGMDECYTVFIKCNWRRRATCQTHRLGAHVGGWTLKTDLLAGARPGAISRTETWRVPAPPFHLDAAVGACSCY